jgi:hypothetical protein
MIDERYRITKRLLVDRVNARKFIRSLQPDLIGMARNAHQIEIEIRKIHFVMENNKSEAYSTTIGWQVATRHVMKY